MRINLSSIRQISCQIKMAVVQAIFEEGVQSAASRVKEEFPGNQAADLISKEFQKLAGSCLRRHLEVGPRKMRYELVQVWPMVERELANLRRLMMRRVKPTPNVRVPWTLSFSSRIPLEVFGLIRGLLKSEIEGAICDFTDSRARWIIKIKNFQTLKELFSLAKAARERTPRNDEGTLNFIREFTDIGYGQIVVEEEKPFTLIYSRNLETLKLNCFYGFWNSAGFPQHPV